MKLIAIVAAATAFMSSASNAVTVSVVGVANDALGRVSLEGSTSISGRAFFVSTTNDIQTGAFDALSSLLSGSTSAQFDSALASLIGATSGTSPGIVLTYNIVDGLIQTNTSIEVGNPGNQGTLFIVSESGGSVTGIGAFVGPGVPGGGAMIFNPTTTTDTIGIGTSVNGFQLAPAIPEPSIALLGALGVFGLIRRRR